MWSSPLQKPGENHPVTVSRGIIPGRISRNRAPSPKLVSQVENSVTCLLLLTPLSAGTAAVVVFVSLSTNSWLHIVERMPNPAFNGSNSDDFLTRQTVSGLWKLCYTLPGNPEYTCDNISYFPFLEHDHDSADLLHAIPYAVTRSAIPFVIAFLFLAIACMLTITTNCSKSKRYGNVIGGIMFIISGILMLFGMVMFLSIFKAEVGQKLRYMTLFDEPKMTYEYGYSSILYMIGFIAVELAGTSSVCLFFGTNYKELLQKMIEEAKSKGICWDRKSTLTDQELETFHRSRHEIENEINGPFPSTSKEIHKCREGNYPPARPHCSIHKNKKVNLSASSLKDLTPSTLYGFPPAPRPIAQENYFEEVCESRNSANTLSGVRSVSIFQSQNSVASIKHFGEDKSRDEEFVTFAVRRENPGPSQTRKTLPRRFTPGPGMEPLVYDKRTTPV